MFINEIRVAEKESSRFALLQSAASLDPDCRYRTLPRADRSAQDISNYV